MQRAGSTKDVMIIQNADEERWESLYSRCTAIIHPPVDEDYGIAPLEGMASGKPVIAINEGGPTETIVNNETGFLINDLEEMAKKMAYVAEHASIAKEMGKRGIARVRRHYSWDRFFAEFDKELGKVAKGK